MRLKLVVTPIMMGLMLIIAVGMCHGAPLLSILQVYSEDEHLCLDFYLKDAIDRDLIRTMRDGIPTLLSYRVDVWHDRANWYDNLVKSVRYSFRMHYDNWDTTYCVNTLRNGSEETITAGDVAELVHVVCNQQRLKACPLDLLGAGRSYYITISAEIEALSAERVREIDSWLGGEESDKADGGGMLGFVVGLFSGQSKTAETKSSAFSLEGLLGDS